MSRYLDSYQAWQNTDAEVIEAVTNHRAMTNVHRAAANTDLRSNNGIASNAIGGKSSPSPSVSISAAVEAPSETSSDVQQGEQKYGQQYDLVIDCAPHGRKRALQPQHYNHHDDNDDHDEGM